MRTLKPISPEPSPKPLPEASSTEPASVKTLSRLSLRGISASATPSPPSKLAVLPASPYRILHFDIENRPLAYLGQDYTTGEITAIAASFADREKVHVWLLGRDEPTEMLRGFLALWDEADVVTGHYIRKHDLPVISGALLEAGMPPLTRKLTSDTKLDLVRAKYLSLSQESLGAMFALSHRKEHMNQRQWREANRLTAKGLKETKRRVTGDVRQHKALRKKLLELGALRAPRSWTP